MKVEVYNHIYRHLFCVLLLVYSSIACCLLSLTSCYSILYLQISINLVCFVFENQNNSSTNSWGFKLQRLPLGFENLNLISSFHTHTIECACVCNERQLSKLSRTPIKFGQPSITDHSLASGSAEQLTSWPADQLSSSTLVQLVSRVVSRGGSGRGEEAVKQQHVLCSARGPE